MEKASLAHIIFALVYTLIWIAIFFARKDLRRKIVQASILGGILLMVIEPFWALKDYWHPPYILGKDGFFVEDFIFGFLMGGIGISIYDVVFSKRNEKTEPRRAKISIFLMIASILSMPVFCNGLGINSIFVSSFYALIISAIIVYIRRDLLIPSIISGLLMLALIIPTYAFLFNVISTDYWDKYWFLANTKYDVRILGHIPLTELLWYFSWGCVAGAYEFATGRTKSDYVVTNTTKPTDS